MNRNALSCIAYSTGVDTRLHPNFSKRLEVTQESVEVWIDKVICKFVQECKPDAARVLKAKARLLIIVFRKLQTKYPLRPPPNPYRHPLAAALLATWPFAPGSLPVHPLPDFHDYEDDKSLLIVSLSHCRTWIYKPMCNFLALNRNQAYCIDVAVCRSLLLHTTTSVRSLSVCLGL
jgi:hypothetical protein